MGIRKYQSHGVQRVREELRIKYSIEIGRDRLAKLLKLWELFLGRKIRKNKPSVLKKIIQDLSDKVNILIRTKTREPFQAITSDITEIRYIRRQTLFMCS